jgi:serine/threonine protein kinase/Tol biopolymer transport system component
MDAEGWRRLEPLLDAALDLEPAQRTAYVERVGAGDPELADALSAMLQECVRAEHFLTKSPESLYAALLSEPAMAGPPLGTRVGPYRLVQEAGRGGMGMVFVAERADDQYRKRVALKVIRGGVGLDPRLVHRFREERQILASLDHPGIARLLDGGVTPEGLPWFAMEYVQGTPLDAYADARRLPIDERLRLFLGVCHAVHDAHRNRIVHRDLKPSNVLVTDDGHVRLLDFGIAKLLAPEGESQDLTQTGSRVLTPDYASPEQLLGQPVTVASDVYSLGVVLYELLTGRRPFDVVGGSAHDGERRVLEDRPEPPSVVVGRDGSTKATARGTTVERLRRRLSGDLDAIVLTALRKEPQRRYPTVGDFAADLRRDLSGLPVTARRDSVRYRAVKFVRRHRVTVTAGTAAVLLLASLASLALLQSIRVSREMDRAAQISSLLVNAKRPPVHRQVTFHGSAWVPALSPDGAAIAYAAGQPGTGQSLMVRELAGGQPVEIARDRRGFGQSLTWSPDGSSLLATAFAEGATVVIPRRGGPGRKLPVATHSVFSPDGSRIAGWLTAQERLWFTDVSTGDTTSIALRGDFGSIDFVDWSPSGAWLAYETRSPNAVWTVSPDGKRQSKVVEDANVLTSPRWSADGEAVYYLRVNENTRELWKARVSPETGAPVGRPAPVLAGLQAGESFSLSRDGRRLLYTRELSYSNLWLIDLNRRNQVVQRRQLTTGTAFKATPTFSPDGSRIAFSTGDARTSNIFVLPTEGGEPEQLTFLPAQSSSPVWSPDGREIAFVSTQGGRARVWRVPADGGTPRPLSGGRRLDPLEAAPDVLLSWAPGRDILYPHSGGRNYTIVDTARGTERALVANDSVGYIGNPRYEPDGKRIAVRWIRLPGRAATNVASLSMSPGIWILGDDGSQTLLAQEDLWPIGWPRDGNRILALHNDLSGIFEVSVADGAAERVLSSDKPMLWASASPSGSRLVVAIQEVQTDLWAADDFDPEVD